MLFRTHVVFGVFCFLLFMGFFDVPLWVLGFVFAGSVFVDLDSSYGKVGRKFWFLSWFFKHRGFLHSLIGGLFFSLIIGFISLWGSVGFFIGYLSHLMIDCFTRRGVALFWPLRFRIKGFIRSGSWIEDVLFVVLLFLDFVLFIVLE